MTIEQYIDRINQRYKQGNATEHTFRGDLGNLLEALVPESVQLTNLKDKPVVHPITLLQKVKYLLVLLKRRISVITTLKERRKQEDPVVHFYETFLGAYNPLLRKASMVHATTCRKFYCSGS